MASPYTFSFPSWCKGDEGALGGSFAYSPCLYFRIDMAHVHSWCLSSFEQWQRLAKLLNPQIPRRDDLPVKNDLFDSLATSSSENAREFTIDRNNPTMNSAWAIHHGLGTPSSKQHCLFLGALLSIPFVIHTPNKRNGDEAASKSCAQKRSLLF